MKQDVKLCLVADIDVSTQLVRYEYKNGKRVLVQKHSFDYIEWLIDRLKNEDGVAIYVDFETGFVWGEERV